MTGVPPAPIVVAASLAVSTIAGALHLAFDPAPFASDASVLVTVGMIVVALVAVSGVLLARGRWSQPVAVAVAAGWIAIVASGDLTWLAAITLATAAITVAAALGPWLRRWVRHRPAVDGPPPAAVAVLLLLLVVPVAVGVTVPSQVPWFGWALAAWSVAAALALARAIPGALLAVRLLHAPACVAAGLASSAAGGVTLGALGAATAAFAWRREVAVAVTPAPGRQSETVRIPPELAPPGVLDAAGADDTGRKRT
jgi:hypothetical protein